MKNGKLMAVIYFQAARLHADMSRSLPSDTTGSPRGHDGGISDFTSGKKGRIRQPENFRCETSR